MTCRKSNLPPVTATIEAEHEDGGRVVSFNRPLSRVAARRRARAAAALHPRDAGRPGALPDRLQPGRGIGGFLHSRPALHARPADRPAPTGIGMAFVTLHIGLDTFQPVKVEDVETTRCTASGPACRPMWRVRSTRRRLRGGRVIAVGTTAVRTLEWAATGAQGLDPYDVEACPWKRTAAFDGSDQPLHPPRLPLPRRGCADHQLPPAAQHAADAGQRLRRQGPDRPCVPVAIDEGYRFYSFGDAMLIL